MNVKGHMYISYNKSKFARCVQRQVDRTTIWNALLLSIILIKKKKKKLYVNVEGRNFKMLTQTSSN